MQSLHTPDPFSPDATYRPAPDRLPATHWLLTYLAQHGPTRKDRVTAAWLRSRRAGPAKRHRVNLKIAFQRLKARGLVTGRRLEYQGRAWWRLAEPGELPRRSRPKSRSVVINGQYRPPWGSGRQTGRIRDWRPPDPA